MQGPAFEDVVLQHAERLHEGAAVSYSFIPQTVLGDWSWEVRPGHGPLN